MHYLIQVLKHYHGRAKIVKRYSLHFYTSIETLPWQGKNSLKLLEREKTTRNTVVHQYPGFRSLDIESNFISGYPQSGYRVSGNQSRKSSDIETCLYASISRFFRISSFYFKIKTANPDVLKHNNLDIKSMLWNPD